MKPHILYASFRREKGIYSWDLRGDPGTPLRVFNRALSPIGAAADGKTRKREPTNQRMRFDIDLGGKFLGVGDQVRDVADTSTNSRILAK
jgi:telomerase Cajal body protein 1